MIAFKYTKTDGAEYLSHLDVLRHIDRTFRRGKIEVNLSLGFNKHPLIYLNNPLGLGIKSVAEYGAVDSDFQGDFIKTFNDCSPSGIKCKAVKIFDKNPNYANGITACEYKICGIAPFDPIEIENQKSIVLRDLRGREIDIRPRICSIEWKNGVLSATLLSGANNLRPDLFTNYLSEKFGGKAENIVKTKSIGDNVF